MPLFILSHRKVVELIKVNVLAWSTQFYIIGSFWNKTDQPFHHALITVL